jgi:hypothetical protein
MLCIQQGAVEKRTWIMHGGRVDLSVTYIRLARSLPNTGLWSGELRMLEVKVLGLVEGRDGNGKKVIQFVGLHKY